MSSTWCTEILIHTVSHHPKGEYNNQNWGVGVEHNHFHVGVYRNSINNTTVYAQYRVDIPETPFSVLGGYVSGYPETKIGGALMATLKMESGWNMHVLYVPPVKNIDPVFHLVVGHNF